MDIDSYFDLSKPLPKFYVPKAEVGGRMTVEPDYEAECLKQDLNDMTDQIDYAQIYRDKEDEQCLEMNQVLQVDGVKGKDGMSEVDDATSLGYSLSNFRQMHEALSDIYTKFNFSHFPEENLPIGSVKEAILNSINSFPVIVIRGATGSGKSTQVPQYILDDCKSKNIRCNIVVTQPRRLAAMSIARRIATQRKWPLGSLVGYQVGLDNVTSENTLLSFVTVGVLLQKLVKAKGMNEYTHVILDEVHERDKDMDFLMLIVRRFLRTNSRFTKVILMSATINVDRFASYFSMPYIGKVLQPAAVVGVKKTSKHIIQDYYLNELSPLGELPEVRSEDPRITPKMYQICISLIKVFDKLDVNTDVPGSVLIFLPGLYEIEELDSLLHNTSNMSIKVKYEIIPLHSSITIEEQKRVFQNPVAGIRKIILSTNIAESSITVPDISYVIDFCLTKQLVFDSNSSLSALQLAWASHTNCKQRAGRAGRVADGRVYRLVPKDFYNSVLAADSTPEILRCSLERLVLFTKKLNLGSDLAPHEILALALDPPNLSNIKKTILILKEIGALLKRSNDMETDFDGDITFLGHLMAVMPVDVKVTKLIVLGYLFSVLDESVIMGAGMSVKNIFSTPFKESMNAYNSKLIWADGSCSDLIAILNVYKVWDHNIGENLFNSKHRNNNVNAWAHRHFLQPRALNEMRQLILEIKMRLKNFNIVNTNAVRWNDFEKSLVLKVIICGAFYPDFFVRMPNQIDEREAVKLLGGRTPHNTVYLQGMDPKQPGLLYKKRIKEVLNSCASDMLISFDNGNNKVYVQFPQNNNIPCIEEGRQRYQSTIPGNTALGVYRAVRLRQLATPIRIPVLPVREAQKRAEELGIASTSGINITVSSTAPELPGIETSVLAVYLTHIIDPGHFWAQYAEYSETRNKILQSLSKSSRLISAEGNLVIGKLYAAPYDAHYYRARVESIIPTRDGTNKVVVFFIDYGNTDEVAECLLRILPAGIENLQALAIECVLSKIQPSVLKHSQALWTDEAYKLFIKLTDGKLLHAKIYSVSQGIVSVELFTSRANSNSSNASQYSENSINQLLLSKGLAQPAEESYLSKANHEMRSMYNNMESAELEAYNIQQKEEFRDYSFVDIHEYEPPKREECNSTIVLRGPFCPLEMNVYSLRTRGFSTSAIKISGDSVNAVLLDPEPQDMHERLMVAAGISASEAGDSLKLRYTTLMPNIHGFPILMSLLFCPKMELRTNKRGSRFVSALCGLGYRNDELKRSLFREHDIVVNMDVEIEKDDIAMINNMRYWMNTALYLPDELVEPNVDSDNISKCQERIKVLILDILEKNRKSISIEYAEHEDRWGNIDRELVLEPGFYGLASKAIYELHNCIDLKPPQNYEMEQHQIELMQISKRVLNFPSDELTCQICDITVLTLHSLRIHLISEIHKCNCEKFNIAKN